LGNLRNSMGGTNIKFTVSSVEAAVHQDTWTADNGTGSCKATWGLVGDKWLITADEILFTPKADAPPADAPPADAPLADAPAADTAVAVEATPQTEEKPTEGDAPPADAPPADATVAVEAKPPTEEKPKEDVVEEVVMKQSTCC